MKGIVSILLKIPEAEHRWMKDEKGNLSWEDYFVGLARDAKERSRF